MIKGRIFRNICIIVVLILFRALPAQKYFSGTIDRDTRWLGDIYINGDVVVEVGVILSVESGSRIIFQPRTDVQKSGVDKERAELIVEGVLLAKASSSQSPIVFTSEASNAQMNDWYGIILKNRNQPSVIQNCLIEFGYKGITCYGSFPIISDSEIKFNYNAGISCEVQASPRISRCIIMGNGFTGINCELASSPILEECVITQNNYGVIIFSRSSPDLGHRNPEEFQSGGNNRIFNNFDFNIYNHSVNTIYAQNNIWNTEDLTDIRQTLYDKSNNPAYGEIIFEPIFTRRRRPRLIFPPIAAGERSNISPPVPPERGAESPGERDTTSLATLDSTIADSAAAGGVTPSPVSVKPETVIVYKELKQEEPAPPIELNIQEPILEAFLDSGKREYIKRVKPRYPDIYLKTGAEGEVYIEVIVDRDGTIEDYRVLRSAGELFTDAALKALLKYRYKPGTIQGKPVKFKIVELFRFKRSQP